MKQDGPSLESSSYLNVSLSYLGPWDPAGTMDPLDLGIFALLDLIPLPTPHHAFPYILLPTLISSSYSTPLV